MGLDAASLRAIHPRLIVCDISGYGLNGPYRDKKAYDLLIQSEAGYLSITGTPEQPSKSGNSIADIAAGMYAYTSILAALLHRDKTGEGAHIDVSMLESLTEWMGFPLYYATDNAPAPARNGASHATIYPYGPFLAGDGNSVMLGLQNEREWVQFCEVVMQNKALATDQRFNNNSLRHENKQLLEPIILQVFASLTAAQVIERLDLAQIANARMNNMADVWAHPQLQARNRWVEIDTPNGKLPALLPPGQSDAFSYTMGSIPAVGEHTQQILNELGIQLPPSDKN
jgi:crotonobetainyl-CoA:carnitine CoA-transferase CaiB-like acyl-CoA transferase